MATEEKRQAVAELAEMLRNSSALAVADYRGLKVSEMHAVRRSLKANGVQLHIAKNRLLKIAADQAGLEELKPMLAGPTAVATVSGDEVTLAKALQEAFRPYKVVSLRGGLLGKRGGRIVVRTVPETDHPNERVLFKIEPHALEFGDRPLA